jgi:hypothetical protein
MVEVKAEELGGMIRVEGESILRLVDVFWMVYEGLKEFP